MYSNKENINILTSLLIAHGVTKAVICPGSRNAPIVHNLVECGAIDCYPVTDERSAGFYALGMAQAQGWGVAVCVTSGSALLNLLPAVAEAYYQNLDLVIISADRPLSWIDQQDGQTLQQPDALRHYVKKAVTIAEPHTADDRWYCNRLVNEALLARFQEERGLVHINVPLAEPLFEYTVETLPQERKIELWNTTKNPIESMTPLFEIFADAKRPMIVFGQNGCHGMDDSLIAALEKRAVVVSEALSDVGGIKNADDILAGVEDWKEYLPDFVLYIGDALVSKRLKQFLRQAVDSYQCIVNATGEIYDTFMSLKAVIKGDSRTVLEALSGIHKPDFASYKSDFTSHKPDFASHKSDFASRKPDSFFPNADSVVFEAATDKAEYRDTAHDYICLWHDASEREWQKQEERELGFSEAACVKYFEEQLQDMDYEYVVHYANSTSIRLANRYACRQVYCNRGVNGIEGSLSTAAGMSVVTEDMVFCVIGDLSFFYDQNALWNQNLRGNLRIILLNNGGGAIFSQVAGLKADEETSRFVMASHQTSAQGICTQNDIGYIKATDMQEMQMGVVRLLTTDAHRPMVLEVLFNHESKEI